MLAGQGGTSEPVAFVALTPILLLVLLSVLQVAIFGYVLVVTESAARDAIRAGTVGESPHAAVQAVSTATGVPIQARVSCSASRDEVTVKVAGFVPRVLPLFPDALLRIERELQQPVEVDCPY